MLPYLGQPNTVPNQDWKNPSEQPVDNYHRGFEKYGCASTRPFPFQSYYDEAIRLDPNYTEAIDHRAKAMARRKELEAASLYNSGVTPKDRDLSVKG